MFRYCPEPVFLIMDVTGGNSTAQKGDLDPRDFPMQAYYSAEEVSILRLCIGNFIGIGVSKGFIEF